LKANLAAVSPDSVAPRDLKKDFEILNSLPLKMHFGSYKCIDHFEPASPCLRDWQWLRDLGKRFSKREHWRNWPECCSAREKMMLGWT